MKWVTTSWTHSMYPDPQDCVMVDLSSASMELVLDAALELLGLRPPDTWCRGVQTFRFFFITSSLNKSLILTTQRTLALLKIKMKIWGMGMGMATLLRLNSFYACLKRRKMEKIKSTPV